MSAAPHCCTELEKARRGVRKRQRRLERERARADRNERALLAAIEVLTERVDPGSPEICRLVDHLDIAIREALKET